MEFSLLTIFSGAIGGSIITLTVNHLLATNKEKKRLNEYRKSMIRVVEKRLIPKYKLLSDDYFEIYENISNHIPGENLYINIQSYSLKEKDLRDYFPLEDIIKIFNRTKNVGYNSVLKIEELINVLNRFSPEALANEYCDILQDLYKNGATKTEIETAKAEFKEDFMKYQEYSELIIKVYKKILQDLKESTFNKS